MWGAAEDLLGLVEQFGIDPPEWMGEWLEGVGQTLDGLESIDLTRPMSILTGGIKALSGVVKQVFSLGGIINWGGSNAKEVQATMERLTNRNELLQTSIEDLTDTLKQSRGTKSVAAYRDAYKMQQETNSNYLQMAMAQAGIPRQPPQLELLLERFQPSTDRQTERADWPPVGREPVESEPGGDEGTAFECGHVDANSEHRQGRLWRATDREAG